MKAIKIICAVLALICVCVTVCACDGYKAPTGKAAYDADNSSTRKGTEIKMSAVKEEIDSMKVEDFVASDKESDYVLIKVKDYGEIVVVLRSDVAPVSVANFKMLVSQNFYAGTIFHRIIEGFMIQGGGLTSVPNEDGSGTTITQKEAGPIIGEFYSNGFENNLYHVRGVISMARSDNKNSATSQFFIVHKTSAHLNGEYASFGYVLAGMDVVDKIAACDEFLEKGSTMPLNDIIIESITFVEPK
jgi:peptidyl-prolyl cis-trans isomerase B (cyclophilin B)